MELHDHLPGLDHLVGIAGPQHDQSGNGPQRRELLDRLVRRAVLADADRIVREDIDHRDLHDRSQPDRHPAIVAEDQESGAEGADLDQRHPVQDGAHRVLADAEVDVAARVAPASKSPAPSNVRRVLVDGARSAAPPISQGTFRAIAFKTMPDEMRVAIPLASAGKAVSARIPAFGKLAMLHPVELVGQLGVLGPILLHPAEPRSRSALPRRPMPCWKWP